MKLDKEKFSNGVNKGNLDVKIPYYYAEDSERMVRLQENLRTDKKYVQGYLEMEGELEKFRRENENLRIALEKDLEEMRYDLDKSTKLI